MRVKIQFFIGKSLLILLVAFNIGIVSVPAQSKAHEKSRFAIIDPTYSAYALSPESNINPNENPWIYGASELESWRLQVLQERKDAAKLIVNYPGSYHIPYTEGSFRLELKNPEALNSIKFQANGQGDIYINGKFITRFLSSDSIQNIDFEKPLLVNNIEVNLNTEVEPTALLIHNPELSTSFDNWEYKSTNTSWKSAYKYPQNFQQVPPHKLENPIIKLKPIAFEENVYDFGKEVYGLITLHSKNKPVYNIGESKKEALDIDNKIKEQSQELIKKAEGVWQTKTPLAFRYLYTQNDQITDLTCEAIFHPASYKGAFAASDSTLTKIWMNSAYTLRLNMQDFLLDGLKRDRLPWTGDLSMSMLVDAFTFSDQELARRSLVALGRAGIKEKDINGIIDYSLWWIIAQDQYQLYFDDPLHLIHEWDRIKEALEVLEARSDENGFLIPEEDTWLFIDWVEQDKWTALQVMWWWAQRSGIKVAQRIGDQQMVDYLTRSSGELKDKLKKVAWNEEEKIWISSKNNKLAEKTRHPNFLAVVSGLTPKEESSGIQMLLENEEVKAVGTPYMAGYEVMALAELGNVDFMLDHTINYWGGMLEKGATTFWEAYDPEQTEENQYAFYGRPYAKSLNHAWSSGPAAFLPSKLFGLEPVEDGWKRFTLNPQLGHLEWASVCLPTKYGNILVDIVDKEIQISIPQGTTLEWKGDSIAGPRILREEL